MNVQGLITKYHNKLDSNELVNTDRTDRAKRDPYNGRVTAKHQYTCTKGTQVDYFLPRDAAEKNMVILEQAPVTKIPVSIKMFSTRLFSALACIRGLIFEVMRTLSNQKWAKNRGG